jgi:hypothetical protein
MPQCEVASVDIADSVDECRSKAGKADVCDRRAVVVAAALTVARRAATWVINWVMRVLE